MRERPKLRRAFGASCSAGRMRPSSAALHEAGILCGGFLLFHDIRGFAKTSQEKPWQPIGLRRLLTVLRCIGPRARAAENEGSPWEVER